jgi:hypothetical protein
LCKGSNIGRYFSGRVRPQLCHQSPPAPVGRGYEKPARVPFGIVTHDVHGADSSKPHFCEPEGCPSRRFPAPFEKDSTPQYAGASAVLRHFNLAHVRLGSITEVAAPNFDFRFTPESGRRNRHWIRSAGRTRSITYTKPTTRTCASGFGSMYLCVVRRFACPASS